MGLASGKRVAIVQSNYIPWKGYFDMINMVDEFVLYDDVQYTRRDWRNRNKIKTPRGVQWLTIPVNVKGRYHQKISETETADPEWRRRHWACISQSYAKAEFFAAFRELLEPLYVRETGERRLSLINHGFITAINRALGVTTVISWSSDYELEGDKTERLASVCRQAGATEYVSGPAARDYMDESVFSRAGIKLTWMDYSGYPEYRQLHPPFEHAVSVLDLIFNEGPNATRFMKSFGR